jgi:hypothetical protein
MGKNKYIIVKANINVVKVELPYDPYRTNPHLSGLFFSAPNICKVKLLNVATTIKKNK